MNKSLPWGWKCISNAWSSSLTYNLDSGNPIINLGINFPNNLNPDLTWEKLYSTNIGFDAVVFNNLSVTFDCYNKVAKAIIKSVVSVQNKK